MKIVNLASFIVNEWGYVRKRGSTNGWHNVTCRKSRSNQNKDGDRIIIPAGQWALAMKSITLRCKHVCGIFDSPEFRKCVSSKSKNKQTKNTSSRHANFLWIRDILTWYFLKMSFIDISAQSAPIKHNQPLRNFGCLTSTLHCGLMLHFIQRRQHLLPRCERCWPGVD